MYFVSRLGGLLEQSCNLNSLPAQICDKISQRFQDCSQSGRREREYLFRDPHPWTLLWLIRGLDSVGRRVRVLPKGWFKNCCLSVIIYHPWYSTGTSPLSNQRRLGANRGYDCLNSF